MITELGPALEPVELVSKSDSTTAMSGSNRLGVSKLLKHVETRFLFLQQVVRQGRLKVKKVGAEENVSDLMTKHLSKAVMEHHRACIGLRADKAVNEVSSASRVAPLGLPQMIAGIRMCLIGLLSVLDTAESSQDIASYDNRVSVEPQVSLKKGVLIPEYVILVAVLVIGIMIWGKGERLDHLGQ